MTCHHRLWTTHTVERCRVWLYITALGLHAWSDNVRRGMTSSPFDSTQHRMTSGESCHHHLWAAHTVERHRVWHAIIALRQHTRSNDIGHYMTSPPLDSTHGRMTSGVACHHRLWAANTIERHRAWNDITAFGQHIRSNDVGHGIISPPLDSTHGQTTSGVACHHRLWAAHTVERHRALQDITAFG